MKNDQTMTKTLTFLTMIAAKIMKHHEKLTKMSKNDIFEYDCSENHEIMVVLMDLEAETLPESRYFYARPAQISFKS